MSESRRSEERKTLSITKIRKLLGCAMQYELSYGQGYWAPPRGNTVRGRAVDKGYEQFQLARMADDPDPIKRGRVALEDTWEKETAKEVDWEDEDPDQVRLDAVAMGAVAMEELAGPVPYGVQLRFDVPIPRCPGWELVGYMDVLEADPEGPVVVDLKTSKNKWPEQKPDLDPQGGLYLWAARQGMGVRRSDDPRLWEHLQHIREAGDGAGAASCEFRVVMVPGKRRGVVTQTLTSTRGLEQIDYWYPEVFLPRLVKMLEDGNHAPNPEYMLCQTCPPIWRDRCMPWRAEGAAGATGEVPF